MKSHYFSRTEFVALTAILLLAFQEPCLAYIDPGTGSMFLTAILGGLAAGGYAVRKFFLRIRQLFGKGRPESRPF